MSLYLPSGSRVVPIQTIKSAWSPTEEVTLSRDIRIPEINYLNNDNTLTPEFRSTTSWHKFSEPINGYVGFIYRISDVVRTYNPT